MRRFNLKNGACRKFDGTAVFNFRDLKKKVNGCQDRLKMFLKRLKMHQSSYLNCELLQGHRSAFLQAVVFLVDKLSSTRNGELCLQIRSNVDDLLSVSVVCDVQPDSDSIQLASVRLKKKTDKK